MANSLKVIIRSAQLSLFKKPTILNSHKLIQPEILLVRSLYSKATLGLDGFNEQRERVKNQMENISDKFKEKMTEYTKDDSKNMIFTEDLKNMVHLAESEDDVDLTVKMIKRFNQQNKQLRFGSYIFGPVVMRMLYTFNKHEVALELFKSPEMDGFFDQLITYQILLDMLYENQRYQEMLDCFNLIKDRQIEGTKYPRNIVVLTFAACYKLNSKQSWEFALDAWKQLGAVGHLPMRRAVTFCAALALNQGEAAAALEILSVARNQNYTTIRNLKVAALVDIGRVEDAIPVLKSVINQDDPSVRNMHTFNKDVMEKVKEAVVKSDNPEVTLEFNRLEEFFKKQGHISELTIDEQLCAEIQKPPMMNNRQQFGNNRQQYGDNRQQFDGRNFQFNRNPRDGRFNQKSSRFASNSRPGLQDLV